MRGGGRERKSQRRRVRERESQRERKSIQEATLWPHATVGARPTSSHGMYKLNSFIEASPPRNRQLILDYY